MRTITFVLLTFALSWGWAAVAHQTGFVKMPFIANDPMMVPFLLIFMCGPAVAALIFAAVEGNMKETLRFRMMPNPWWLAAWLVPLALVMAAWAISLQLPGANYQPLELGAAKAIEAQTGKPLPISMDMLFISLLVQVALIGPLINMFGTLTEELGWRGYMLTQLAEQSFWTRHLTIGFFWGVWHTPVIVAGYNYPGEPILGPLMFTGFCMLLSPVIGLIAERGRSVLAAGLFHGTINAAAPAAVMTVTGLHVFESGIIGWPGLLVFALACAMIGWFRLDRD
jgi:uncharacterized protein